jgi:pyruvate, water dikinase
MILDRSSKEKIALGAPAATNQIQLVVPLKQVNLQDIAQVGGKNASLGEMLQQLLVQGINVPDGFATTATAYRYFLHNAQLEAPLERLFQDLDAEDVQALQRVGKAARSLILNPPFPAGLEAAIATAYTHADGY